MDMMDDKYMLYKQELLDRGGEIRSEVLDWEEGASGVNLRVHLLVERDVCR